MISSFTNIGYRQFWFRHKCPVSWTRSHGRCQKGIWTYDYDTMLITTKLSGNVLQWRYNERGGVSNHQPHECVFNRLFRRRSRKTSKLCVTGLCEGNLPMTGEFPAQMANNAENVSIWWSYHCLMALHWIFNLAVWITHSLSASVNDFFFTKCYKSCN